MVSEPYSSFYGEHKRPGTDQSRMVDNAASLATFGGRILYQNFWSGVDD